MNAYWMGFFAGLLAGLLIAVVGGVLVLLHSILHDNDDADVIILDADEVKTVMENLLEALEHDRAVYRPGDELKN